MSVNAEVTKSGNETALNIIRKFSRRVQGAGLIKTMRNRRYYSRDTSKVVKKKRALKVLKRRAEYRQLVKEGKVVEAPTRGRHGSTSMRTASQNEPSSKFGDNAPISR